MLDGGYLRATDILKALALGADFVFIGRPFNYAASIAGEAGVRHAIDVLRVQLRADLGLLGVCDLSRLDRSLLFCDAFREVTPRDRVA